MGIFDVMRQHLAGLSCVKVGTADDLSKILRPTSDSRTKFWEMVVVSATRYFFDKNNSERVTHT